MQKILELTKVMFLNGGLNNLILGSKKGQTITKQKKTMTYVFFMFLILIAMFGVGFAAFSMLSIAQGSDGTLDIGYLQNILTIYVPLYFALVLVFSNSITLSTFFLSKDNEIYISYPIKSHELFIAKLINCLIYGYFLQLILVLPCVIAFDIVIGPQAFVIINEILLMFFYPFIPFTILLFIQTLFSKIINYGKHKTLLSMLTYLLSLVILMAMELFASTSLDFNGELTPEVIIAFKESIAATAHNFEFMNFFIRVFTIGGLNNSLVSCLSVLLYGVISIVFVVALVTLCGPGYSRTLVKNIDIYRKHIKTDNLDKLLNDEMSTYKTPFGGYILKEFRVIMRSPNNVVQLVLPPFLFIGILAISIFATLLGGDNTAEAVNILRANMQSLATFNQGFIIYCIEGISCFLAMFNLTSASSISREGNNAYFLKYVPTHSYMVILAKIFWPFILNTFILSIIIWGGGLYFNLPWYILLLVWIGSLVINLLTQFAMIAIDIKRPYLNWVNELDPIKQNLNTLYSLLTCLGFTFFFIFLACFDFFYLQLNIIFTFIISLCITTLLTFMIIWILKRKGAHVFDNIQ